MHLKLNSVLLFICGLQIFTVLGDETEAAAAADKATAEVPRLTEEMKFSLKPQTLLPTWIKEFNKRMGDPPHLIGFSYAVKDSSLSLAASIQNSLEDYRRSQQGSRLPRDCDEAVREKKTSGVYKMELPASYTPAFHAYCLVKNDAVWMLIQRRIDGKIKFDRDWNAYKSGFGDLSGEHWLGLDFIHAITDSRPHELSIVLSDQDNMHVHAHYKQFLIGNEYTKYALKVLGSFNGTAKDSLMHHAGHEFSTKDADNDKKADLNCANISSGGWWFTDCGESNLNGVYREADEAPKTTQGIQWNSWHGEKYSLKYAHMAIRPVRRH